MYNPKDKKCSASFICGLSPGQHVLIRGHQIPLLCPAPLVAHVPILVVLAVVQKVGGSAA